MLPRFTFTQPNPAATNATPGYSLPSLTTAKGLSASPATQASTPKRARLETPAHTTSPPAASAALPSALGRKAWAPSIFTSEFYSLGKELDIDSSHDKTQKRIISHFITCRTLNPDGDWRTFFQGFVGSMLSHGLKWSTISQYLNLLQGAVPTEARSALHRVKNIAATKHCEEDSKSAHRISNDRLLEICSESDNPFFWLLASTGLRAADAARLMKKQIRMDDKARVLHIEVRLSKNRRRRGERAQVSIPYDWFCPPPPSFRQIFTEVTDDCQLFGNWSATRVNELLRKMSPGRVLTSYSFRKTFIHNLVERLDKDFSEAQKYTLHFSTDTIRAYYTDFQGSEVSADDRREFREEEAARQGAAFVDDDNLTLGELAFGKTSTTNSSLSEGAALLGNANFATGELGHGKKRPIESFFKKQGTKKKKKICHFQLSPPPQRRAHHHLDPFRQNKHCLWEGHDRTQTVEARQSARLFGFPPL